jgi:tetratricopeptide (TPR) repeat protein
MQDLDVPLRDKLDGVFKEARSKLDASDPDGAVKLAELAWQTLPQPKFDWDVSKSYVQALAAIYRDSGQFQKAISLLNDLFASGTVQPHQDRPRLVLGTVYFEMGDLASAKKWLQEANKISKGRCFNGQPKKYKDLLTANA